MDLYVGEENTGASQIRWDYKPTKKKTTVTRKFTTETEPRQPQRTETNMPVRALDVWLGNTTSYIIEKKKQRVTFFLMHSLPNETTREKYGKYYKQEKEETCL